MQATAAIVVCNCSACLGCELVNVKTAERHQEIDVEFAKLDAVVRANESKRSVADASAAAPASPPASPHASAPAFASPPIASPDPAFIHAEDDSDDELADSLLDERLAQDDVGVGGAADEPVSAAQMLYAGCAFSVLCFALLLVEFQVRCSIDRSTNRVCWPHRCRSAGAFWCFRSRHGLPTRAVAAVLACGRARAFLCPAEATLTEQFCERRCEPVGVRHDCCLRVDCLFAVNIDACSNDCALYYGPHVDCTACPECAAPRIVNGKPAKRFSYLSILPQLIRLYSHPTTARAMRWGAEHKAEAGVVTDVTESPSFRRKFIDSGFLRDPRNAVLALCADGQNPFKRAAYSMCPIVLELQNLAPDVRIASDMLILVGIVPGPNKPRNLNTYLKPLIDEILINDSSPSLVFDAATGEHFRLRVGLHQAIGDHPGQGEMTMQATSGVDACTKCDVEGVSVPGAPASLKCFLDARRDLPPLHPLRFNKDLFGSEELRGPHSARTHEGLKQLALVVQRNRSEFGARPGSVDDVAKQLCMSGYSELFRVPGFDVVEDISIDIMHVKVRLMQTASIGCSLFARCVAGENWQAFGGFVHGPQRGTAEAEVGQARREERQEREERERERAQRDRRDRRQGGWGHEVRKGREKRKGGKERQAGLRAVERPTAAGREAQSCINGAKGFRPQVRQAVFPIWCVRLQFVRQLISLLCSAGFMTAHDWLVFLTTLARYSLRDVLADPWLHVVLRLGDALCGLLTRRVVMSELDALQTEVVEALALFELYFPKREMSIVYHLLTHATHYIREQGPFVAYWMYPIERFLGFLAQCLMSRSAPEAMLTRFYRQLRAAQTERLKTADLLRSLGRGDLADALSRPVDERAAAGPDRLLRFAPHEPLLPGKTKRRTLSAADVARLVHTLRLENEQLDGVYRLYEDERQAARAAGEPELPPIAAWVPKTRALTAGESRLTTSITNVVEASAIAIVGGVEFRCVETEANHATRTFYFRFISRNAKGKEFTEYGQFRHFFHVRLGELRLAVSAACSCWQWRLIVRLCAACSR
jgi:hypothetical protein